MKLGKVIGIVAIGLAAAVVSVIAFGGLGVGVATFSLGLGSEAKSSLERLGVPDGATEVSLVHVVGPDGPMPEIATRSFGVRGDASRVQSFYRARCDALGLG